jgi:large subunit ribosomal protein L10
MTKQEKFELVKDLSETFKEYPNFYITDSGNMTVEQVGQLRRRCFDAQIPMRMIKNTLIRKALENLEADYTDLFDTLKEPSYVFFAGAENPSAPAKLIKDFNKEFEKPLLKAASIETSVFKGHDQLDALTKLKSKDELIGEVITLLQSPAKNVLGALQSGGQTIAGIIKTLEERDA